MCSKLDRNSIGSVNRNLKSLYSQAKEIFEAIDGPINLMGVRLFPYTEIVLCLAQQSLEFGVFSSTWVVPRFSPIGSWHKRCSQKV